MPWGITLLAALSVLLLFKVGDRLLKRLNISMMAAQIIIFMLVAGSILPNITLGKFIAFNIGGFIVPIFIAVIIMRRGNKKEVLRGILSAVVVAGALMIASYFIAPIPQGYIVEPMVLYGLIAAVVAFIAGYNLISALSGAILGIVLWDIAQALIVRYVYNIGVPIELGLYGLLNTLIPAVILAGAASYLIAERHERREKQADLQHHRLTLLRRKQLFEISDPVKPDTENRSEKENEDR